MNEELKERLAEAMWLDTEGGNRREKWEDAEAITRETYLSNVDAILAELGAAGYAVIDMKVLEYAVKVFDAHARSNPTSAGMDKARGELRQALIAAAEGER